MGSAGLIKMTKYQDIISNWVSIRKKIIDISYDKLNYAIDENNSNPCFSNPISSLEDATNTAEKLPKKLIKNDIDELIELFKPFNFMDYPYNIDDTYIITTTGFEWSDSINILFESFPGKEIEFWV